MVSPITQPDVSDRGRPLGADLWHRLIPLGVAAPSLDNSQPWSLRLQRNGIDLYLDRSRVPADDVRLRQSLLSCGAVLFNLRVALLHSGCRAATVPLLTHRAAVAGLRIVGRAVAAPDAGRLLGAIPYRRTWIGAYRSERVADPILRALGSAATAEGARLQFVNDPHQRLLAENLLARTDDLRRERHPATAAPRPPGTADGSRLAVLTMPGPESPIAAGQALQRVLLTAAAYGLSSTLHAAVVESPADRNAVGALLSRPGTPMAVLHLGYGGVLPAPTRRDAADVLLLG